MRLRAASALACLALAGAAAPRLAAAAEEPPSGPDECGALAALDFTEAVGAEVKLSAVRVAAEGDIAAHCRVTGSVAPEVGVEVWLPLDEWNGKLFVAGCYGLCGAIRTDQFDDAFLRGYATATTDGGHSETKYPGSTWALNNTALEEDFGHRAVHVTTLLAKALVEAFYGNHEEHAYFRGCSTGGRQALVAAQRYPDDFDGIIAGAPFHQTLSVPHMIWVDRANTGPDGRPLLRKPQLDLLHDAVLAACDANDKVADDIVGNPEDCAFEPKSLTCAEGESERCLSEAQVEAATKIYRGPGGPGAKDDAADKKGRTSSAFSAPFGAAFGSELTWARQLVPREGNIPYFRFIGQNWMRFHAFEPDPGPGNADLVFDFDKDFAKLAPSAARIGFTPDLERFAARDGRLIVYHGWLDESLQPSHTLDYWRKAVRENGGAQALARIARLYMLPGVLHCGGGPGAGDVDYLTALERWVEADEAPDMLIAWRTRASVPATVRQPRFPLAGKVEFKRPLFPYPDVARYKGSGDALDPANYQRVTPNAPPAGP